MLRHRTPRNQSSESLAVGDTLRISNPPQPIHSDRRPTPYPTQRSDGGDKSNTIPLAIPVFCVPTRWSPIQDKRSRGGTFVIGFSLSGLGCQRGG